MDLDEQTTERSLEMTDDRNRATHTYQLKVDQAVSERARTYFDLLHGLTERVARRIESS